MLWAGVTTTTALANVDLLHLSLEVMRCKLIRRKAVGEIGGQGKGSQSGEGTVMGQQCRLVSTRELMKATTVTHYQATHPQGQMGET